MSALLCNDSGAAGQTHNVCGCGQKHIHPTGKTGVIARPLVWEISRKTLHPQSPFAQNARALQTPTCLIGVQIVDFDHASGRLIRIGITALPQVVQQG
jgi:hypothetical protein